MSEPGRALPFPLSASPLLSRSFTNVPQIVGKYAAEMSGLSNHRRKKVNDPTRHHSRPTESDRPPQIPSSAYVTAYEAQLIYGRDDLADRITRRDRFAEGGDGESGSGPSRGALIRWEGEHDGTEEIWLDRYVIYPNELLHYKGHRRATKKVETVSSPSCGPKDVEGNYSGGTSLEFRAREGRLLALGGFA